jgi:uncharacterized protein
LKVRLRMKNLHYSDILKINRPAAFNVMLKPAGPACNLNCTYCYYLEKKNLYPGTSDLKFSDELLEKFIREFIGAHEVPIVTFTWQGGEPTLMGLGFYKKALELQKKYSRGRKIENSFQTNGTRLTPDWCKYFSDNNILVGISIDGKEHVHDHYRKTFSGGGTFSKVMEGINMLKKYSVEFNTLSTVTDYSSDFGLETYRFLREAGSGYMQFLPVVERIAAESNESRLKLLAPIHGDADVAPWSVKPENYGDFLITIFDEWVRNDVARHFVQIFDATLANHVGENPGICVFNETCGDALAMEHNGDLYSCDHFVFPEYLLGNISDVSLSELAVSQRQLDFGIQKRNSLPAHCLKCDVRFVCHGECPKHRFLITPDGKQGLNYFCEGLKKFFRHSGPYMAFMAEELNNQRPPANVMEWARQRN